MIEKKSIIPNFLTVMGMFCGFYSMVASIQSNYTAAAYAILAAFIFDGLDGKVARALNATSKFGVQLDSLSDLVSFGVAPAILIYMWLLIPYGRLGYMAAFLFVACGALRLARFNVQAGKVDSTFFVGLPIPSAAGIIASSVLFVKEIFGNPMDFTIPITYVFLIYLLAFLMVSSLPYYSFKKISGISRRPFKMMVLFVLFVFIIGMYPEVFLFLFFLGYIFSGLLLGLLRYRKKISVEESIENV